MNENTRKMTCKTIACNWEIPCEVMMQADHVDPTMCLLGKEKVVWE